ncbi:MAG: PTS glucitol/sorbitol transporter subunit IIA [Propionibacteriales bacterium]|nr:PTS glucitol/sorbitol transporter subunit IIA [Propionibacteriales bacterium]
MTEAATGEAGDVVYQTTVTSIGEQVPAFVDAGILILFAAESPEELHSISVLHTADIALAGPVTGDIVQIGDVDIPVLAVGSVVEENLLNLGHVDFKADGRSEVKLPGDVCVPKGSLPTPEVAQVVRIIHRP